MAHRQGQTDRHDQADRLRCLARGRAGRAVTLAIASGKGGVGKSTVAVNLSICLAARGLRVTLVDTDMGLANADLLMNVQPRYTLAHVLSGAMSIESACTHGPGGIRFLAGASGREDLADLSEFARRNLMLQLKKLEISTDIIVLDCGAGISRNVTSFALAADAVVIVTTPEPTALTDAYALIKLLHRERCGVNLRTFINTARSRAEALATYRRLAGVAERFLKFSIADGGFMLHDVAVELAVQQRRPFVTVYPRSNASACMVAMATDIAQSLVGQPRRSGLFRRVAGLFL